MLLSRRMIRSSAGLGLLLGLAAQPAHANSWIAFGDGDLSCSFFLAGESRPHVATVAPVGEKRLHFIDDGQDKRKQCPSLEPACRSQAYLLPGDEVVVTKSNGAFACAHHVDRRGRQTSGLVHAPSLDFQGWQEPKLNGRAGLGRWKAAGASIDIRKGTEDFVILAGDAWLGPPKYRTGAIEGPAFLTDNDSIAGYQGDQYRGNRPPVAPDEASEPGCRVRLRLLNRHFLIVDDNDRCGGQGVSFAGLYRKAK